MPLDLTIDQPVEEGALHSQDYEAIDINPVISPSRKPDLDGKKGINVKINTQNIEQDNASIPTVILSTRKMGMSSINVTRKPLDILKEELKCPAVGYSIFTFDHAM